MSLLRFFRRSRADAEQREELEFYLEVTTREYIERGMDRTPHGQRHAGNWAIQA